MSYAYPMMLDVTDRLAVIVGGGAVAARKAKGLLAAGAKQVRVVAPAFHADLPAGLERIGEPYHPRHLTGASLVFAATDAPEINDAVVRDARSAGLWVCRADADDDAPGDFTTPAIFRDGPILLSVSTASPALAAAIRDELAGKLDPRWAHMAQAMRTLRPALRGLPALAPPRRRDLFRALATPDARAALEAGGLPQLWHWIVARYPELEAIASPFDVV